MILKSIVAAYWAAPTLQSLQVGWGSSFTDADLGFVISAIRNKALQDSDCAKWGVSLN